MAIYKRSQVEDSLWAVFRAGAASKTLPAAFRFRIKKLLDLDRIEQEDQAEVPLVFNDQHAQGQGQDVPFTSFHAFMLGLGLELWNAGQKQNDVVYFLRHCRNRLETQHARIIAASIVPALAMGAIDSGPTRMVNGQPDRVVERPAAPAVLRAAVLLRTRRPQDLVCGCVPGTKNAPRGGTDRACGHA